MSLLSEQLHPMFDLARDLKVDAQKLENMCHQLVLAPSIFCKSRMDLVAIICLRIN